MTRKVADKADETDSEEDQKNDAGDKDADKSDGGGGSTDSGLEHHIRELVEKAVDSLLGDRSESGKRSTQGDDEDELYRRVKHAQDRIKKDEEKEGRLAKVEEKVEKVLEKPPARDGVGGKIQRWFWGGED